MLADASRAGAVVYYCTRVYSRYSTVLARLLYTVQYSTVYCTVLYSTVLARLLYCTVVPYCTVRVTQSAGAPDRDTPEGTNTGYKPYRGCGGGAHERATTPRRVRIVSRGAQREPAEGLGYFNLRGVKLEPAEATTTTKRGQRHPLETGKQRTQR